MNNTIKDIYEEIGLIDIDNQIREMIEYSRHTHVNNQKNDMCKSCGHYLTHLIHLRYGED